LVVSGLLFAVEKDELFDSSNESLHGSEGMMVGPDQFFHPI